MKKPVWLLLILVLSIWYSQSALMSSEVQPNQVVIQSGKCDVTDPAKPETNLFDNNSKTVWNTSALSGTQVKLVLKLAEKVFLDYMEFSGVAENNQTVSLEYSAQDGTWCPLIGCQKIPLQNGRIDLSLSGVKSGSLRLVFNSQGSNQRLAEIGEVKVYGDKTESMARLNTQITVSGRNASNPVGFLNDYNTYTVWQPQAGTVTLTLESASVVKQIKLYIQKSVGILNFTVWRNDEAVLLASKMDLSAVKDGWNTIELPGILTDRIQINLTDVEKSCGGIGEVEVWGETIRDEVKIIPLGRRSVDGLRELGFDLIEVNPQTEVKLYFSLPEQSTNLKPRLNINGTPVDGIGSTIISNGVTLGQIKCESNLLRQGNNVIVADFASFSTCDTILAISQNQGILGAKVTTPTSGESPSLGDGLKYTEISNLCDNTFELQLASVASVDCIRLVGAGIYDPMGVCVYIWENNVWNMVSPDLVSTEGNMVFIKGGTEPTEKIKLNLAKRISPCEIMVFGSEVNQTAPRIILTQPEGLTVNAGASLQVEGYVDNAEAAVTFNGTPLQLQEHFFSYPVFINSNDPTFTIEIIAINRQGRKGVFRKTLAINSSPSAGLPILNCDLPDNYYTSNSHITVKGTASQTNEVSVNSEPAEFQNAGGIYTRGVDLIEGENKVTIKAKSASGAIVSLDRRIIRDSQPPVIEILETTQNDGQLIIKGSCSDASPVELQVNGQKTVLSENTFTYTINLVNGKNLINIAAKDLAGNEASDEIEEVLEADAKLAIQSVSAAEDDGMDYTNIAAQYDAPGMIDTRITGPYGAWLANNRESVSPATGSLMISANDLSLPGRDGFDFELIRLYNSEKAQSDLIRSEVILDTFGAGWTANIPWVNKDTKQLYLPTGQIVKVDGTVWTSPGSKYECHEGVHFSLEYSSEKGYTLIVNDGAKYLFDTSGKLIDKFSPNSQNTIHFSYNDREIAEIIDSIGRKVKFTYKTVGSQRLIQSIEAGSRMIEYDYDANGLLKSVIDPMKRKTEYTYEYYGNKEFGTKYQNVTTKWEKVIVGYTTRTYTDPITGEKWTEYVPIYDIEPVTTYGPVVNKLKQYDLYLLETISYPTGLSSVYSYYNNIFLQNYDSDKKGFFRYRNERFPVKEQTIGARHINYSYQMSPEYGDIIDRNLVLKNSYILSATVAETGGKTIKYNLQHVKKSSGNYSLTTYPTSGDYVGAVIESSQVGYDSKEFESIKYQYKCNILEPTFEQHLRGDQEIYRITSDYDTWGNLTTQIDSRTGLEKEITYLNHATVKNLPETVTVINKDPITGGNSQVTTTYKYHLTYIKPETITVNAGSKTIVTNFSYYDNGNLKSKTNPNGLIEALEYDANNAYPAKKTFRGLKDADGKPVSDIVNQFGYDSYGRKQWEMDGRGYATYYEYDDLNRVTAVYLPDDDDTPFVAPSKAPSGNPYREYKFDDTANTCEFWNENRQKTLYRFDGLGRLTGEVKYNDQSRYNATESKTVYHYDDLGRMDYVTDPNNHTVSYQYDGLSRLKKIIYPMETSAAAPSYAQLDYDDVSNTVTIRQENGNIVIHKKDWADRLIAATQQAVYGNEIQSYQWSFQYDSLGNKVQQTNPLSKITNYTFDPFGHLEKVQLPSDSLVAPGNISKETVKKPAELQPTTICEYDEMGNKIKESDANGDQVEYKYDGLGRVILVRKKVTRTNLSTKLKETVTVLTKYYYDAGGNKVKTSDPNGHAWLYDYSARGFLLQEEDPEGNRTQYRYDPIGNTIAVIDPRNASEAPRIWYSFSGEQLVLKDSRNDKTFTTWFLYDNYNRLYRTVMPDNTPPSNPFEAIPGYDNPYTETWYNMAGNKESERDATGLTTQYTYFPRNWLKTLEGPGKKEAYEYDATGNQTVTRIWTDIAGDSSYSITKQYDSLGRIRKVTYPESTEEYTCDPFGNRLTVKDGNGNLTKYKYNNYGWQTEVIDPLKKTTTYRYDPNGNKVATITAKNLYFINRYDEQNRVAESVDSLGVSTFYNYDAGGNLSGKLDPRKTTWQYVYNYNNTLKQLNLTGADQTTYSVNYTYDKAGNRMTVSNTGKINNIITYNDQLPDPMNRINTVERQFDGKSYRTEYEYNPGGQLKTIKYPEATEKITYQYNESGRLNEVKGYTQPAGITYFDDGSIKNISLANNVNTQYSYNLSRRLQDLNVTQANNSLIKLSYIYDLAGNIKTINDQVSGKQSTFNYYENNWLKSESMIGKFTAEVKGENGGVPGHVEKDYQGDQILDFVSPKGVVSLDYASSSIGLDFGELNIPTIKKIQLVPDNAHQTHRLIARSLEILTSPENVHYTLVPKTDWTFSKDDQGIITITLAEPIKSRIIKIHCLIDNRDTEGNSINKATFINELAQMIRVYEKIDGQKTCNYQYDNAGNRIYREVVLTNSVNSTAGSYVYYADSDRLLTDGEYAYAYDAAGNLIAKGNRFSFVGEKLEFTEKTGAGVEYWKYRYDLLNRLSEVCKNGEIIVNYGYDPEGLRVVKTNKSGTFHYIFEGTEPIFEKNITSGGVKSYVYALGKHLARVDGVIGDSVAKRYYYHTDQVGSIRNITDQQGNSVFNADYMAFGSQFGKEGSLNEQHGFTGKEYDPDTGLYYFNARWYDSELGRFVSEDSDRDGDNWYIYGANNPLRYTDPTGNIYEDADGNWQLNSWDTQWDSKANSYGFWLYNDDFFSYGSSGYWFNDPSKQRAAEAFLETYDFGRKNWVRAGGYDIPYNESRRVQTVQAGLGYPVQVTGWYDQQTSIAVETLQQRYGVRNADSWVFGSNSLKALDKARSSAWEFGQFHNAVRGNWADARLGDFAADLIVNAAIFGGGKAALSRLFPEASVSQTSGLNLQFFAEKSSTLNPKNIHFMQSSIKNTTGEYTVIGNANALRSGILKPSDLPAIRVWKDPSGKIWTLDHRRLAAYRMAGIEEVPVQWMSSCGEMWKMTTTNGGTSIRLKLGKGQSMIVE